MSEPRAPICRADNCHNRTRNPNGLCHHHQRWQPNRSSAQPRRAQVSAADSYIQPTTTNKSAPTSIRATQQPSKRVSKLSSDAQTAIREIAQTTRPENWPPTDLPKWCKHLGDGLIFLREHDPPLIRQVPPPETLDSSLSPTEIGELPLHREGFTKRWHTRRNAPKPRIPEDTDYPFVAVAIPGSNILLKNKHYDSNHLNSAGIKEMRRWQGLLRRVIDTNAVFLGGWSDPDNGQYEINLTIVLEYPEARRLARRLGELWDQKSVWIGFPADKGKEILTGGSNSARWPFQK